MGPANSEPLLISLAAELEALGGWAGKQPAVWWNTGEGQPARRQRAGAAITPTDPSKAQPAKLFGVALPILRDLDA